MLAKIHPRFIVAAQIFGILITLLIWSSDCVATCVVAIIDYGQHKIVVAADALDRHKDAQGQVFRTTQVCKIFDQGSCVVSISGRRRDKAGGFDIDPFINSACEHVGTLRDKADYFIQTAEPRIKELVEFYNDYLPAELLRTNDRAIEEIVFAGVEEGQLKLIMRQIVVSQKQLSVGRGESDPRYGNVTVMTLGSGSAIGTYLKQHPNWSDNADLAKMAKMFVGLEIKEFPISVGPPISVLEIDQSVMLPDKPIVNWVDRGACK